MSCKQNLSKGKPGWEFFVVVTEIQEQLVPGKDYVLSSLRHALFQGDNSI